MKTWTWRLGSSIGLVGVVGLLLLPLGVLLAFFLSEINGRIAFAEKERLGVAYHQAAGRLLDQLLQGQTSSRDLLAQVAQLDRLDRELGVALQTTRSWEAWKTRWKNHTSTDQRLSAEQLQAGQQRLVQDLLDLMSLVGDTSNLILDPSLDSYYLMNVLVNVMPPLQVETAALAEQGLELLQGPPLSSRDRLKLDLMLQRLHDGDLQVQRSLERAMDSNPALQPVLVPLMQNHQQHTLALQDRLRGQWLDAVTADLSSPQLLQMAGRLQQAQTKAVQQSAAQLELLLEKRIAGFMARRRLVEGLAALMVLFSIYAFRGILRAQQEHQTLVSHRTLLHAVFASSAEGFFVTGPDQRITGVNPAFTRITGYTEEEVQNQHPLMLTDHPDGSGGYSTLLEQLYVSGNWEGEVFFRRKNGEAYPCLLSIRLVKKERGEVSSIVASFSDISERKAYEQNLLHLANHDVLTGLPNRNLLQDRILQALAQQQRSGGELAVMFLNLDHFKGINESLGHATGDQILLEVARRIRQVLRQEDTLARQGGDEFMVLLPAINHWEAASQVASRILQAVDAPYAVQGYEFTLQASIGISMSPRDGSEVQALMRNADTALSRAKQQGRNTYQFYTAEMNGLSLERLTLENELRQAISRNELLLHYQPQVDLHTGQVVGVEALVRWQHPEKGMVSPGKFIPLAEETGLIVQVGEWVLREACRQSQQWRDLGFAPLKMSVNLSARQFRKQNVPALVQEVLALYQMDPAMLDLEFTESLVMENTEQTLQALQELKQLGVQLSVDDFGTGYSSLSYLRRFPLDTVKIDRAFVQSVDRIEEDATLARAIIALAHSMGLKTVAEGVETREQLDFLMAHHCDEVQGFYFSKPLSAVGLERLLAQQRQFDLFAEA